MSAYNTSVNQNSPESVTNASQDTMNPGNENMAEYSPAVKSSMVRVNV